MTHVRFALGALVLALLPTTARAQTAPASVPGANAAPRPGIYQPAEAIFPAAPGQCTPLPLPRSGPPPFPSGERLRYDVDVMGVRAGEMEFDVLPFRGRGADIPVRVRAESNTFFDKVRKVKGEIVSTLRSKDLRPRRFLEDLKEGDIHRQIAVSFPPGEKYVRIDWKGNRGAGSSRNGVAVEGLDYVGAIYLFRALPLRVGESFCFDVYALRKVWRMEGKVEAREHLSTPAGEFDAFHLSGVATRVGGKPQKREVHVWISDDAYRLPVAAVGVIDLGPVRATLTSIQRPDLKSTAARPNKMEW